METMDWKELLLAFMKVLLESLLKLESKSLSTQDEDIGIMFLQGEIEKLEGNMTNG